jgi:hypothetical protein
MTGRFWRRAGFCLALAALAACGVKGDPVPPDPDAAGASRQERPWAFAEGVKQPSEALR